MWGRPTFELELHLPGVEPEGLHSDGAPTTAPPRAAIVLTWTTSSSRAQLAAAATLQQEYDVPQSLHDLPGPAHVVQTIEDASGNNDAAAFFRSLEAEPGTLTWKTQHSALDAPRQVEASFAFGAADAVALRTAALQCGAARISERDPG
jgi:hypothetical protein